MVNKKPDKSKEQKIEVNTLFSAPLFLPLSLFIMGWIIFIIAIFTMKNKVLFYVVPYVLSSWHFWFDNCPFADIITGLFLLGIYASTGFFFIRCFDIFMPLAVEVALGFALGVSLLTVPLELLAIFKLLYPASALSVLCISLIGCYLCYRRHRSSSLNNSHQENKNILFRAGYRFFILKERQTAIRGSDTLLGNVVYYLIIFLVIFNIALTFYHALFYPETYWDSLIYYMGYGRMTFLEHGFPVKVTAQVGLGLGANYPHLFPLLGATLATVAGYWADIFPQLIAPLAGIVSTILVYHIISLITGIRLIAALGTLLFRSVPYGIAYFTFASDYSLAIMFTAAFLYLALLYLTTYRWGYLIVLMVLCAGAVHLNYMMWFLWIGFALLVGVAHTGKTKTPDESLQPPFFPRRIDCVFLNLADLLKSRRFLIPLFLTLAMASTWYIRNIIVTGNPVYAFFPEIYGGKHINPDVLESCFNEWRLNGDGIGRFGASLMEKIRHSWTYFVTWQQSWKLAPVFVALGIPGFLLSLVFIIKPAFFNTIRSPFTTRTFLVLSAYTFSFLLFYHYLISDLYLYHILPILVPVAIYSSVVLKILWKGWIKIILIILCLYIAFVPGLSMSLMGFKFTGVADLGIRKISQLELFALRNPCMPHNLFYRFEYGEDVKMWDYINIHLKGKKILSHENRNLLYDPSISFVHLDDWDVQQLYSLSDEQKIESLKEMGIEYYLYIPMEDKHPVVRKLGVHRWAEDPDILIQSYRAGDNVLYRFVR